MLPLLLALMFAQEARKIEGGTSHKFKGITFDIPGSWRTTNSELGLVLVPNDANQGGTLEEAYAFASNADLKELDGEIFDKAVDKLVEDIQPGMTRRGRAAKKWCGALEGRVVSYESQVEGRAVEVRVYALSAEGCVAWLIAFGYQDVLAKREREFAAVLGSLSKEGLVVVKRPTGGDRKQYNGVSFELPKHWKMNATNEGTTIMPDGANSGGTLEEAYLLVNDASRKSIDGGEFDRLIDEMVGKLQPGVGRESGPTRKQLGELDGRVYIYKGDTGDGRTAEVRVYAFLGTTASALVALGYADVIAKRERDLEAILSSLGRGAVAREPEGEMPPTTVKRIPNAKLTRFRGVAFDLPSNWQMKITPENTILLPEGANPTGALEELYLFVSDPKQKSIDSAEFDRAADEVVAKLQPGAKRQSAQATKFGDLDGRVLLYRAKTEQGRDAEVRVHAFMGPSSACGLVALGYADVIAKRDAEISAILGSMWRPKSQGVVEELVGSWAWITNFNANNGGGRQTSSYLTLNGDGTFVWKSESITTVEDGNPGVWGANKSVGTWTATDTTITLTTERGSQTFRLEKRNHPKNTNDPMIFLDGKPFVTVNRRPPW